MSFAFTSMTPPLRGSMDAIPYRGSMGALFERLRRTTDSHWKQYATLDCARLLQGIIEYKIQYGEGGLSARQIHRATVRAKTFLSSGRKKDSDRLVHDAQKIRGLDRIQLQHAGSTFYLKAIQEKPCNDAAKRMAERTGGRNILVIALGGSGILPALQTAICYENITGRSAEVYPVRFSNQTRNDTRPLLNGQETGYLRRLSSKRGVVIFDDVIGRGNTMRLALDHFSRVLDRPDVQPEWGKDANGNGERLWPAAQDATGKT